MIRLLIKTHFASLRSALSSASNSRCFVARAFEEGEATEEWLDMSGWVVVVKEREGSGDLRGRRVLPGHDHVTVHGVPQSPT